MGQKFVTKAMLDRYLAMSIVACGSVHKSTLSGEDWFRKVDSFSNDQTSLCFLVSIAKGGDFKYSFGIRL